MSSWVRYALSLLLIALLVGLTAVSLFPDALVDDPTLSLALLVLDVRVLVGFAVALFAVSLLLYLYYLRREDPSKLRFSGRAVEAIVPVYNDADVMHQSVEHLADSAYENLTVTIVPEPDDAASVERAAELAAAHESVRTLVNDQRQGSKAGAINYAVEHSDADVIALFDADQRPHPKLIPHGMAYLDGADITRIRSVPRPTGGLVESVAYYEYLLLYFLPQKLVKFLLGLEMTGTRSVLLERRVFETVGLLEEDTLTEDLDFAHRCHQAGMRNHELLYYPTFEEPAHTWRDWWGQRVRWMTGSVEVGHSQLRNWRQLLDPSVLGSLLTVLGTFAAGVLLAVTVPKLLLGLLAHPLAVGAGLAGLYAVPLATRFVDNRTADMSGYELSWLLLPVVFTMFGLVIHQSVLTYVLGWDVEWYSVDKSA